MSITAEEAMTIDELARRTGMTVRNIRAHQSRGLLPPPEVKGRTGFYGSEHVARIELIKDMQADGFNLEAIRRLVASSAGNSAEVLGFRRAVMEPFADEEPEIVEAAELAERWNGDAKLAARAERLGLIRPLGDGRFEVTSPRLYAAGAELAALGIDVDTALAVIQRVRRHADGAANAFIELFLEEVWRPFDRAGRPPEEWPRVREALDRLRPLASEAMLSIFQFAMTEDVEEAFGRVLRREAKRDSKRSRRND